MAYVTDTKEVIISGDEYLDVTISKIKENISTFEKQKDEKKLEKWLYIYDCMSLFFKAYPDKIKPYIYKIKPHLFSFPRWLQIPVHPA